MARRLLSGLAVAAVVAVAVAAAVDSLRGDEPEGTPAARSAAQPRTAQPSNCLDSAPCLRGLRKLVAFYRGCVRSWNGSANRANQAGLVAGGFDQATLFRSTRQRCSLYFVSSASSRILLARRLEGRWWAVGGGRRPPAADDFDDAWAVGVRPDGTLSLRQNPGR